MSMHKLVYATVEIVIFGDNMKPKPLEEVAKDLPGSVLHRIYQLSKGCSKDTVIFYCPMCGTVACIPKDNINYIFERHARYHERQG